MCGIERMGKHSKYGRKYRKEWETQPWSKGWLVEAELGDLQDARCKVCNVNLRAHRTDLKRHTLTQQHIDNMKRLNPATVNQSLLTSCGISTIINISNEEKERDLKLALYIAAHSAIQSMDHLCDLLNEINKGTTSTQEKLKLHRTKCSCLIKNVIAPALLKELVIDVGDMPYSLLIDESTDIFVFKYMCLCIKYFSLQTNCIKTEFLGLIPVEYTTADALYVHVEKYLSNVGLNLANLVGIGTDGGSNLCGKNHSLYTLLKEKVPNLLLVRCVCHSLDNASSKASIELPANVDFLCHEVFNWFNCSPLRRVEYKKIFDLLNSGSDDKKTFHQFVQLSNTRWLARYNVVNTILEHWLELKTHFELVIKNEKCCKSRLLNDMLHDDSNYLYLKFLKPILYEVNQINLLFQKTDVDIGKAYDDLCGLIMFLARKFFKATYTQMGLQEIIKNLNNELAFLPLKKVDFGIDFYQTLLHGKVSNEDKILVQNRAFTFLKKLRIELTDRLPKSLDLFKKLKYFSSESCLNPIQRCSFKDLPFLNLVDKANISILENQWNKLLDVDWASMYEPELLKNTFMFWPKVFLFQNAGGNFVFRELSLFVLKLLSLPGSNAVVERVFSVMNAVKIKSRNRLNVRMLDALMRIRFTLYTSKTCKNFKPTKQMFINFNSNVMYNTKNEDNEDDDDAIELVEGVFNIIS